MMMDFIKLKKAVQNVCRGFWMDPVHLEKRFMFLSVRTTGLTSVVEENFKQQMGRVIMLFKCIY